MSDAKNKPSYMIQLKNVSFRYQNTNIDSIKDIDLNIKKGEFIVLTGASGCGKTTLSRAINGLAGKFYGGTLSGNVILNGRNIDDYKLYEIGKIAGSIFQDPKSQFFASITEDEIAFGCENYGLPTDKINKIVEKSITMINGSSLKGKYIYPMSSGEKQKIAVASVYAVNPEIYVFDEPSANLDMYSIKALKKLMQELKQEGCTIIVAEHRLYYLMDIADRFIHMENGVIKETWSSKNLYSMPDSERKTKGLRAIDLKRIKNISEANSTKTRKLSIENINFSYKKTDIFANISFELSSGDIVALVGHNGVGKTTLANIICGIKKEKTGNVYFSGKAISVRKRRKESYFVMQNTDCQLFADSVKEELLLNMRKETTTEAEEILELYGLYELRDYHPSTLSGGQKQRLTLAISEWIDSSILILDEPTSGLDYKNMEIISNHLKDLAKRGKTIIAITHDYEFATMCANKVLHLIDESHIEIFDLENNLERLYDCMAENKAETD